MESNLHDIQSENLGRPQQADLQLRLLCQLWLQGAANTHRFTESARVHHVRRSLNWTSGIIQTIQILFYVRSLRSVLCAEVTNIKKTNKKTLLLNPFLLLPSFCPEQNQTAVTGLGLSINFSLACGSRWFKSSSERQRSLVCCWLNPELSLTFVYRGSGQRTDSHIHTHKDTHERS